MPIRIQSSRGPEIVEQAAFRAEVHLQEILAQSPDLLRQAGENPFALVTRELNLRDAGILDIFLVSSDGLPVAVEVKLEANGTSRREVVAQAVDYLSALTTYTNDELEESTNGKLSLALRSFEADTPQDVFERRWAAVGANLRAGMARLLIAVDTAPVGLERIVRFLAEGSELDIQLVAIERYPTQGAEEVVVPRFLVTAGSTERRPAPSRSQDAHPDLLNAVAAYNEIADADLRAVGGASYYRQIRPAEWPKGFATHYEFYRTIKGTGAELHLESDAARPLASALQVFAGTTLGDGLPPLIWDAAWSSGRGRLTCRFPPGAEPKDIAKAMTELIKRTRKDVGRRLQELVAI